MARADPDGAGRRDGRRRRSRWQPTSTSASRPRSPTTCRRSWSTRPRRSRRPSAVARRAGRRARRAAPVREARRRPRRRTVTDLPDLGAGARVRGGRLVQHPRWRAADDGGPGGGRGRADRLLDLHLHQLHPHASVPARRGTRSTATTGLTIVGVHAPEFAFEKDAVERRGRDRRQRIRIPRRPGQRAGDLERLRQPVLAGEVPDRRRRRRSATSHFGEGAYEETESAIRTLLAEAGDAGLGAGARATTPRRTTRALRTPETYLGCAAGPGVRPAAAARDRRPTPSPEARPDRPQRLRARRDAGRSTGSRRRRSTTPRSASASARGACSWCWARRGGPRGASRCCWTGSRSRRPTRATTFGTASVQVSDQRLYRLVELRRGRRRTRSTLRFDPASSGLRVHLRLARPHAGLRALSSRL